MVELTSVKRWLRLHRELWELRLEMHQKDKEIKFTVEALKDFGSELSTVHGENILDELVRLSDEWRELKYAVRKAEDVCKYPNGCPWKDGSFCGYSGDDVDRWDSEDE